jgi:hypothetical protein
MPLRPKDKLFKKSPKSRSWRVSLLRRFAAAALIGCITAPANSLANDTEAELGIGGLVLRKNAHVEMRSEDLYVSINEIRVRYRFYNKSGSDVSTVVAFPLPKVNLDDDDPRGLTEYEFSTRVDNIPVNTQIERRATVGGRDRTDVLKRYGVPLDGSQEALDKLPRDAWDKLTRVIRRKGTSERSKPSRRRTIGSRHFQPGRKSRSSTVMNQLWEALLLPRTGAAIG